MMNLNALKIDPEFQGKIPPLNFEEEQQLEQNILHEGRLLNPIIIWNGFILDGHTRYRILRKHPFIVYQIQEIKLANRYAALSWICQNQLGRRNLDPERKKFLMGKLYESEKLARGGSKERAHDENGRFTSMVQNDPLRAKQLSTCERIAAQNGVGAATVKRAEKYEALLFAVQTGISSELTAGEQLRAKLVAHEENACDFVSVTEDTGVRFALDGIRAPWKIYCIRSAYYIYKSYGASLYREMLSVLVDAWGGDSDSFLSGILHGMARFLALYQGEYSRERLILRLRTVHPKTITRLAQNDTGNVADRHMKQILSIYNGAGRTHNLPCKR